MYEKNLTEDLRLRLTERDMDFLRGVAEERGDSISAVIRSIIGDYRRSIEVMKMMNRTIELYENGKVGGLSNGDNETNKHDKL